MNDMTPPARQFGSREMDLIKRTVAKDCEPAEFDMFMHICRHTGLDPLRRQIYAFVFHKNDRSKRQLVPVVAIAGLRAMAERTGNYRPDDRAARLEIDDKAKNPDTNPLGIIRAQVTVYKHSHGEWFPAVEEAYWDEYVPIKYNKIDAKKQGWTKMPRIMLAKCAEAKALRKAWPDDFGNLYEESELDQAQTLDLSPSEMAELGEQEKRLEKIGGADAIMIDWLDGKSIDRVLMTNTAERINQFIDENKEEKATLAVFRDRNSHALNEFWARNKSDALDIKKRFEVAEAV